MKHKDGMDLGLQLKPSSLKSFTLGLFYFYYYTMSSYSEKLKDPRWQKKRLEVLNRDSFSCQWCGDTHSTLHVHHTYYEKCNPWESDNDCLITICEDCHCLEHSLTKLESFLWECLRNRDQGKFDLIKIGKRIMRTYLNKYNG